MQTTWSRARRFFNRLTAAVLIGQILSMIALTVVESFRKKKRKLRKFPVTRPEPLPVADDEITVYTYGEYLYDAMIEAIDAAEHTIYFETYIWKGDATGHRFRDALGRAADRGVKVHAIWDEFANLVVPRAFFTSIPKNIATMPHPAIPIPWSPRHWGRDHRKLLTVDGRVGFIGGYNIGSLYATGWRDTHARVVGPGVAELDNAFIDFWNLHVRKEHDRIEDNPERDWLPTVRVHRNMPRLQVYPIRNMYLEAIDRATSHIWLTHAYLIPDDDLIAGLRAAVNRGVDVRIIVPGRSNHVVADWLSRGYYTNLLRSGVKLYLYQGAMVHAKTATMDGVWSTIGTANLDRLSLWGNYEVNLEVTDESVAKHMEDVFRTDQSNSIELNEQRWASRSVVAKVTELFLSPWRPFF
ncbi:phosphatidylserine/phosphatidylglycerophosphate/cardiolipin synthase family protein [Tessaracoccus sp. MC1865]|uniref:phospholipase D-like domain-containing protein n=1 Tax=unclassified Tessaracoccus TaxID=2635419 RepID=UPI0016003389|nr:MULTISPECIES: phospholipase D-like domain-containing protein [unclassified Tessaracoccus]MBB1484585.1 phosphatidylserine/phosphatidylglycerophosphate/cardiolipin synthase family protein [Tessaracoccus sp. MC1865]MBB1509462.1 phosphatidylserine/phosphatidylglycerophosphate/cardiolipin synthase family protein [Tessaracoccus sp. MC1756]QTO38326.1 phosphatidylserine/phosphatidylglycerophosphate/cardiolipin synthase family protein [Tessaracoccus sp. MC1865]